MSDYGEVNHEVYDNQTENYRNQRLDSRRIDITRKVLSPFIKYFKHVREMNKQNILEVGPGGGLALSLLEKEGFRLNAIDISGKMIESCKEVCQRCEFIIGDFLEYNFLGLNFNGIFANRVIHTFPLNDAFTFLRKSKQLLAEDGLLAITTNLVEKSYEDFSAERDKDENVMYTSRFRRFWEENDLMNLAKSAGFQIEYKEHFSYYVENDDIKGINLGLKNEK